MRAVFLVGLLAACSPSTEQETRGLVFPETSGLATLGSAPDSLMADSTDVQGHGCTVSVDGWASLDTLEAAWPAIGEVTFLDQTITSVSEMAERLASTSTPQMDALQLNVILNDSGLFGRYSDLGQAQLTTGPYVGLTANELLQSRQANASMKAELEVLAQSFNEGFAVCFRELIDGMDDFDHDGVPDESDCDPRNDTIGAVFVDGLNHENGRTPDELPDEWIEDVGLTSTSGGQQAFLEDENQRNRADVRVVANVLGHTTQVGCGFECAESCGEYLPTDCYEPWEALALGILDAVADNSGRLMITNTGDHDICLGHGYSMWDGEVATQGLTIGSGGDEDLRIGPSETMDLYYGSWTTGNDGYSPYTGEEAWWCTQAGEYFASGVHYTMLSAQTPDDIIALLTEDTDLDGDLVNDMVDWEGSNVRTQHNIWDYQQSHTVVIVGKTAEVSPGVVDVLLSMENRGAVDSGAVVLTDTVPAGWAVESCSVAPDSTVVLDNGDVEQSWMVSFDGCTDNCAVVDSENISCTYRSQLAVDRDHLILPPATVDYFDGEDDERSVSMPAAVFDYDHDSDGNILCGETERWRAGIVARGAFDDDQDEGYHGYRCALSRNPEVGCNNPGYFVQIGEFEDAPEDDISSECAAEDVCPLNTTFDQLAREDHDAAFGDVAAGDAFTLTFTAIGDLLVCEAADAQGNVIRAEARDSSFAAGHAGLSTLNLLGTFDSVQVCEVMQ